MIEFKAECGHTVRAKDEDAGGLVRCSYCGRPANVPEDAGDDLDFLFSDVEQPEASAIKRKRKRARAKLLGKRQRRPGEFNPFAVILRLCYGALLIIIVLIVGRMFVIPLFKGEGIRKRIAAFKAPKEDGRAKQEAVVDKKPRHTPPGLIDREKLVGLFVDSTPPGAKTYFLAASKAPPKGRIHRKEGCTQSVAGQSATRVANGEYVVEVEFAWNDPKLTEYPDYVHFRRALWRADEEERGEILKEYFLPDGGILFADETEDQIYLVRQYRNVEVLSKQSRGVRSLFLPRILQTDGRSLRVEELMSRYIPAKQAYSFDKRYVRGELLYNDVKEADLSFVLEVLSRIGVIPYVTPDRRTLLFKIRIRDGSFAAETISERRR
jgi:hypothetical protein